jgi:hypothetical protein
MKKIVMLTLLVLLSTTFANAQTNPREFNFSGQLLDATGTNPNLGTNVLFTLSIRSTSGCVLYREAQNLNLSTSNGYFSIGVGSAVGSAKRVGGFDPNNDMTTVFRNSGTISGRDNGGSICNYNPSIGDQRELVVTVDDGTNPAETLSPAQLIKSVPSAFMAENAEMVSGIPGSSLLQINNGSGYVLNQSNLESVFSTGNYSTLTSLLAGSSPLYNRPASNGTNVLPNVSAPSSPSEGQIWYNTGSIYYQDGTATRTIATSSGPLVEADIPTLTTPGKVSGTSITSGNISTSGNFTTTGTITASGAITSAGALSGASISSRLLSIFDSDNSNRVTIQTPPTASLTTDYTLTLPTNDGAANQVLQTDGNGVLSWITPVVGGITALTGDVTASGTGSVAATISNDSVTFAKMQNIATQRLIGRSTAASGDAEELSVGTGLTISGGALNLLDTTDDDSFATLLGVCGNGFLPFKSGGVWTCLEATDANTLGALVRRDAAGSFTGTQATLNNLRLNNAGSFVNISPPPAANYSLILPPDDGSTGQVLRTDGSGVLTWVTPAAGSGDFMANGTLPMTDQFRAFSGSNVSPGITFAADPDTGMFSFGAGMISFTHNGTERVRIDPLGNVGIGTTSPLSPLHLVAGNAASTVMTGQTIVNTNASTTGTGSQLVFATGTTTPRATIAGAANSPSGGFLSFNTRQSNIMTETMRLDDFGNVGIGTTAPSAKLQVNGAIAISGTGAETCAVGSDAGRMRYLASNLQFCNGSSWQTLSVAGGGGVFMADGSVPMTAPILATDGMAPNPSFAFDTDTGTGMYRIAAGSIGFSGSGVPRMMISSSGNVGIGTTAPISKLTIEEFNSNVAVTVMNKDSSGAGQYPGMNLINYYSAQTGYPAVSLYNKGGTFSSPSSTASGVKLGSIDFYGSDFSANGQQGASISATSSQSFSSGIAGSRLEFATSNMGTSTPSTKLEISASGELLMLGSSQALRGAGPVTVASNTSSLTLSSNAAASMGGITLNVGGANNPLQIQTATGGAVILAPGNNGHANITTSGTGDVNIVVGSGKIGLGANAATGGFSRMGMCAFNGGAPILLNIGQNTQVCPGVVAGAAVSCSPLASQTGSIVWAARANAANSVTIVMSGSGTSTTWNCMFMNP